MISSDEPTQKPPLQTKEGPGGSPEQTQVTIVEVERQDELISVDSHNNTFLISLEMSMKEMEREILNDKDWKGR